MDKKKSFHNKSLWQIMDKKNVSGVFGAVFDCVYSACKLDILQQGIVNCIRFFIRQYICQN